MFPGSNTGGNGSNGSGGPYSIGSPVVGSEQAGSSAGTFGAPGSSEDPASVQKESGDHEVGTPQIFKATYSGVPVFEMICRGVAVMRRRSDSYLNATQILKVAKFDKPQRTRILEREVQKGEHEKVQGGYGKYQGTWVPYDRGVQLCQEYNVLHLLQPLLEYQFSKINSPPLAPKHITAASNKPRKPREPKVPGTPKMKNMDETMSILSAQSRTPSPLESRPDFSSSEISDSEVLSPSRRRQRSMERSPRSRKKQNNRPGDELFVGYHGGQGRQSSSQQQLGYYSPRIHHSQDVEMRPRDGSHSRQSSPSHRRRGHPRASDTGAWQSDRASNAGMAPSESNQSHYADILLNYFVSDSSSPPSILINPPPDLDFDLIIDEEGHTPLHWAVAMARTKIVKLLVQHGADIYRVNNQGQTALMRSVLFTNNFDMKTFPSLLEILQKTIFTIDKNDQTVFHHVAVTAGMRGKVHASRYYMECLLDKLAQHPQELSSIINVQDAVGDTALIIAARIANKKVVRLLLDAGADPKIRNKSGRNADEFLQDPDFYAGGSSSSSLPPPPLPPLQHQHSSLPASSSPSTPLSRDPSVAPGSTPASQRMIPAVTDLLEQLTQSYEKELYEKEQDLLDARNVLHGIQTEIQEGHQSIEELRAKTMYLGQAEDQIRTLEGMIRQEINLRQRLKLENLVQQEEARLRREMEQEKAREQEKLAGGGVPGGVDMGRVKALEKEAAELRSSLTHLQQTRKDQVEQIVQLKSQQGKRRQEYKRLVALCCNISIEDVDALLVPLLNTLGSEDNVL
ncbi:apses-domain-containing protein [Dissophora ornata]|nr:apses-domain-containing protein [Dissophora ornata]